jgi:hypothetical protein
MVEPCLKSNIMKYSGSSVAAWLSETVLRGRGPGASGFESHRRGRIFSKGGTSAGPWMCVYVFQGLTVGWWKEERDTLPTPPRGQQGSNPRPDGPPMDVCVCIRVVASRKRRKKKRGWAWVAGESTPELRRGADRKVPDRPGVVKGARLLWRDCTAQSHRIAGKEPFSRFTRGSSVAAWLSETVLRGRGPGASGFESHRRGRIFSKEGTSAGPWMCVYV